MKEETRGQTQGKTKDQTTDLPARTLPYNLMAEQMLLGTLLVNNEDMLKVSDFLEADHFFDPAHKKIYAMINVFIEKEIIANPITLKTYFDKEESLKDRGGARYLIDLASLSATIINVSHYGRMIYDMALRRELVDIAQEISNDAFDKEQGLTAHEQIDIAEQKLYNIATDYLDHNRGFLPVRKSLHEAVTKAQSAHKNKGKVSGVASEFADLDTLLGGFQNSDLLILAGRPSMGKTALALNLALNCCNVLMNEFKNSHLQNGKQTDPLAKPKSVGFFSLEMSSDQLASRLISMISGVSTSDLRTGHIDVEFGVVMKASEDLGELPLYIDDTASISISSLRTRARRLKRKHNLGILFVDYLQLIRPTSLRGGQEQNRVQEISEITQALKAIAKELHIPVIALSQLSRAVESREDKRPMLSDLRDSGTIEQDSDIVMFIYREEYYVMRKKPTREEGDAYNKWEREMEGIKNISEVMVSKHRNGPIGNVKLFFDSHLTKFSNLQG